MDDTTQDTGAADVGGRDSEVSTAARPFTVVETRHLTDVKAEWAKGPWTDEPDRVEWRERGFAALALRHPTSGHWCGYLGVPPGHPWHGVDFLDWDSTRVVQEPGVHGGVTFASPCAHGLEGDPGAVCHVPQPGEPDEVWWIGFDCAHSGDLSPSYVMRRGVSEFDVYRTIDYVRGEVASLAEQAEAAR